jgi:peptidoglycan/xylan/chitin deacetylase (PgdA/CDA1 family)
MNGFKNIAISAGLIIASIITALTVASLITGRALLRLALRGLGIVYKEALTIAKGIAASARPASRWFLCVLSIAISLIGGTVAGAVSWFVQCLYRTLLYTPTAVDITITQTAKAAASSIKLLTHISLLTLERCFAELIVFSTGTFKSSLQALRWLACFASQTITLIAAPILGITSWSVKCIYLSLLYTPTAIVYILGILTEVLVLLAITTIELFKRSALNIAWFSRELTTSTVLVLKFFLFSASSLIAIIGGSVLEVIKWIFTVTLRAALWTPNGIYLALTHTPGAIIILLTLALSPIAFIITTTINLFKRVASNTLWFMKETHCSIALISSSIIRVLSFATITLFKYSYNTLQWFIKIIATTLAFIISTALRHALNILKSTAEQATRSSIQSTSSIKAAAYSLYLLITGALKLITKSSVAIISIFKGLIEWFALAFASSLRYSPRGITALTILCVLAVKATLLKIARSFISVTSGTLGALKLLALILSGLFAGSLASIRLLSTGLLQLTAKSVRLIFASATGLLLWLAAALSGTILTCLKSIKTIILVNITSCLTLTRAIIRELTAFLGELWPAARHLRFKEAALLAILTLTFTYYHTILPSVYNDLEARKDKIAAYLEYREKLEEAEELRASLDRELAAVKKREYEDTLQVLEQIAEPGVDSALHIAEADKATTKAVAKTPEATEQLALKLPEEVTPAAKDTSRKKATPKVKMKSKTTATAKTKANTKKEPTQLALLKKEPTDKSIKKPVPSKDKILRKKALKKKPPLKSYANNPDIKRVNTGRREITITFDGGSNASEALIILDTLKARNIKTTLFLAGTFMKNYPSIVRRMLRDGHEIGNHTMSHPELTDYTRLKRHKTLRHVTKKFLTKELQDTARLFAKITGKRMAPFWRAPYGHINKELRGWAVEAGYMHIGWTSDYERAQSLDTLDWVYKKDSHLYLTSLEIRDRVLNFGKGTKKELKGGIILMHLGTNRKSDRATSRLGEMLDTLERRGYKFVKVSRLIKGDAKAMQVKKLITARNKKQLAMNK